MYNLIIFILMCVAAVIARFLAYSHALRIFTLFFRVFTLNAS